MSLSRICSLWSRSLRRLATALLVSTLVALLVFTSTAPRTVSAKIEKQGTRDYGDIKKDFMCRACVSAAEVFFDEVLPPLKERYRVTDEPHQQSTSRPSSSSPDSSSPPSSSLPRAGRRQREQMIVEVHEAIDDLCASLEKSVQQQIRDAAQHPSEDVLQQQLRSPLVNSADLRDGVFAACPTALEEMNEALTDTAFHHLHVTTSKSDTRKSESKTEEAAGDKDHQHPHADTNASETTAVTYTLPAAGTFCEEVKLCSSYVHYHITSDAEVRRRAREGEAAHSQSLSSKEKSPSAADAAASDRTTSGGRSTGEKPNDNNNNEAKATNAKSQRQKKTSKKGKGSGASSSTKRSSYHYTDTYPQEDESLWATALRVFQLGTWRSLMASLNTTEIASVEYWWQGVRLMVDRDVLFHLQAYVPLAALYTLSLAVVLMLVLIVLWCKGAKTASPAAATSRRAAQQRDQTKKQQ